MALTPVQKYIGTFGSSKKQGSWVHYIPNRNLWPFWIIKFFRCLWEQNTLGENRSISLSTVYDFICDTVAVEVATLQTSAILSGAYKQWVLILRPNIKFRLFFQNVCSFLFLSKLAQATRRYQKPVHFANLLRSTYSFSKIIYNMKWKHEFNDPSLDDAESAEGSPLYNPIGVNFHTSIETWLWASTTTSTADHPNCI